MAKMITYPLTTQLTREGRRRNCSAISGRDTLNMVVLRTEKKTMVARNTMSLPWAADPSMGMLSVKA